MPTYQYACTACQQELEAVQSFTDAPLTECPSCGGTLRKVYGAVGVVFKGSGFYKTDSRKAEKSSSSGGSSSPAKESSSAPAASTSTPASTGSGSSSSGSSSSGSSGAGSSSSSTPAAKTA